MTDKTKRREQFITPKGVAIYPWLNKPDTKFKEAGEYRIRLRLSEEDGAALVSKLKPYFDKAIIEAQKNPKRKGKKLPPPQDFYSKTVNDDGEETGEYEFNFKMNATGVSKKDGTPWSRKPFLFDSAKQPLNPEARVFGGSICKVAFTVIPYDTPQAIGIKLGLEAVQVIKLVSGERSADSYGFGDESDDDDADEVVSSGNEEGGGDGEDGEAEDF